MIMNQVSRKNAKTSVKKDFYKLMNNSNTRYDCGNNTENYFFAPILDELEELSYTKQCQNPFDNEIPEFVSSELLEREINETIDNKIATLIKMKHFLRQKKIPWRSKENKN